MQLQTEGKLDDAQVLLFFGARRGHAQSAFAYAELNDPLHHSPETSLLAEPDAFQAYRWYTTALDAGMEAAAERLAALREWTENEAAAGNSEADRLLLQWE
jgi:TPR repeat protein